MAKRDREGNEADILVFRARSADEAFRVRDLLGQVGVEIEMPEAAVQVLFDGGKESLEVRVPLEQADAALGVLEEAFGSERMPAQENAPQLGEGAPLTPEAIEARARELEAEDERRAAARRAQRAAAPPPAPEGSSWVGTLVSGVLGATLLALVFWLLLRQL